jgi:hypothetical protein
VSHFTSGACNYEIAVSFLVSGRIELYDGFKLGAMGFDLNLRNITKSWKNAHDNKTSKRPVKEIDTAPAQQHPRHAPLQLSSHMHSPMGHLQDPAQHFSRGTLINPAARAAASFLNTMRGYTMRFVGSNIDERGVGERRSGRGGNDDTEGMRGKKGR